MNDKFFVLLAALATLWHMPSLEARKPFHATASVPPESAHVSATNLVDLKRDLRTSALEELMPIYTPTSAISIDINLRGIDVQTSFAANSTVLVVEIPQAGISTSFDGGSRDQSLALFKEYIRDGANGRRLFHAYSKYSPIDPIAGNPDSLMAQLGDADYKLGRLSLLSGCNCCWSAQPIVHQFQAGVEIWRSFAKGFDTTAVSLPLRYSYSPDLRWALILDAPLTFHDNGGAYSLFGSVGIGLRIPVLPEWSLTPIVRLGSGGSLDVDTSGSFLSTGITSEYQTCLRGHVLSMTNYAAYITSTNLWLTGINFNYHLQNYVFKNGLSITSCEGFCLWGRDVGYSLSWVDTYFTKKHLFINHYDELSLALFTTNLNPCIDYDLLSIGFAYRFGQKGYKGYALNLIYQF